MLRLVEAGAMQAAPAEIETLAENMTIIATYWLSYAYVRNPRVQPGSETLTRGIAHILSLASPLSGAGAAPASGTPFPTIFGSRRITPWQQRNGTNSRGPLTTSIMRPRPEEELGAPSCGNCE